MLRGWVVGNLLGFRLRVLGLEGICLRIFRFLANTSWLSCVNGFVIGTRESGSKSRLASFPAICGQLAQC